MSLATLEDSQALYDAVTAERGDIGAPGGMAPPLVNLNPLSTPVTDYDMQTEAGHQALWDGIMARRDAVEKARIAPPLVRLWDGGMNLRGQCVGWRSVDFEFIENDTGTATLQLSLSHYLAKWVMNFQGRAKRNVIVTIDKQGARWSGFMDNYKVVITEGNDAYLEITFKHDYEQVKHILCWSNPFLVPEVQFPKLWIIFGPAKWCLLMTLFVNILRLETSLWTLPDNPLDPLEWFPLSLDISNWRNMVKPFPLLTDNSNLTIVFSRFKQWHDIAKPILADAQLTVTCRRYLKDEDPHPFSDLVGPMGAGSIGEVASAIPLRNGCVVWDIVDNSGWGTETAFGGSLLLGLVRAVVSIADDGYTQGVDVFTGNPTSPAEYYNPWFRGTSPKAPWVIYDCANQYNGIKSSEFTYFEATDTSFLVGGHSMPGVNETFSAGVNMAGDFLTSLMNTVIDSALNVGPFGAGFIQIPPLGGVMDSLAKILYEDTFMAFEEVPTVRAIGSVLPLPLLEQNITGLGDFHYFEGWADGADRAFTLAAQMAVRAKMYGTRPHFEHKIEIADAAPYVFGEKGFGHFWIGNRIGTTVPGFPIPHTVFMERVNRGKYTWDKDGPKGWQIGVGYSQPQDPALKALDWVKNVDSALSTLGIL